MYKLVLQEGAEYLSQLSGHTFNVLEVKPPTSSQAAINLANTISKLSPLVGNLIEFATCDFLNQTSNYRQFGSWIRQDPGFPDTLFLGTIIPNPGFEIKAWFPLSTEITARFKDSQTYFLQDQTYVVLMAWLPEHIIFGAPKIIDIACISAASIANYRDNHYNRPPDYIVLEPEDTTSRTINLQQTNMNGYKFQGTAQQYQQAEELVRNWGLGDHRYDSSRSYQNLLRTLIQNFPYRLDTNFAKIDRIAHPEIEAFKTRVMSTILHGRTISNWQRILSKGTDAQIIQALTESFGLVFPQ